MQLRHSFFNRPADQVAQELLGMDICVQTKKGIERLRIHEVEAYMGPHDRACHSSKGRTARTETMFAAPGTIYIYLIYGMYYMLNIVTGEKDYPAAVLIRGAGPYDGPGKLTKALGIGKHLNGKMLGRTAGVWIEASQYTPKKIIKTPRIGVSYAGAWAEKKLRFLIRE